jgi:predicted esterase
VSAAGPHDAENVVTGGAPLASAKAALILIHGRGATAESIMPLADAFERFDIAYLAPQATANTWYPYPFTAPLHANEPWLSSALSVIGALVERLAAEGFPPERVALSGFSQGACLATEFAARNARRYGCIIGLSGGLIGPPGTPRAYPGSLDATPVFLGCSDVDAHIPLARVQETTAVLSALGAEVDERIYPGMGHTVNDDEIAAASALLARMAGVHPLPSGEGAAGGGG